MSGSARVAILTGAGVVVLAIVGAVVFVSRPTPAPSSPTPPVTRTPAPAASSSTAVATPSLRPKPAPGSKTEPPAARTPEPAASPATGTLRIESDVPDTSVFLDRNYLGTAPVTASGLTPGTHHLNMSATGYDGVSRDIEVEAGTRDLSINLKEIRLDATIAVVHKHTVGSCAGQLRATPQGLQYETTKADDAFVVPLTDIETFDVDYLNWNLRVKVRRGKTYNFTDPEGNADRLFVFQRDVEKVRQRLLAGRG